MTKRTPKQSPPIKEASKGHSVSVEPVTRSDQQQVVIYRDFPNAKAVFVAGSFNGWKPAAAQLQDRWCNIWCVSLMLKPGQYEYRFLVDGEWADDPASHNNVPNPFGGYNSVLLVDSPGKKSETTKIADATSRKISRETTGHAG